MKLTLELKALMINLDTYIFSFIFANTHTGQMTEKKPSFEIRQFVAWGGRFYFIPDETEIKPKKCDFSGG